MKISFAICTHNEGNYIDNLLNRLTTFIKNDRPSGIEYEIVVIDDFSEDPETLSILHKYANHIRLFEHSLQGNFADHKNFMNSVCTGDWILNIDADEWLHEDCLGYLPQIIESNPLVEAYWMPRVNTVHGITKKDLQEYGWVITKMEEYRTTEWMNTDSEQYELLLNFNYIFAQEGNIVTYYTPIVAWPDIQMRLYKNAPHIVWNNAVHEQLSGYTNYGVLPQEPTLAIQHYKSIDRQRKQNALYQSIQYT